jgi:hypothetical protein
MKCLECPHKECINPDPRARYPSWIYENRTPEYKQRQNERARERREERRAKGLCTKCGKQPVHGTAMCDDCKEKENKRRRKRRKEKGVLTYEERQYCGLCKRRGCDQKAVKGKKLCKMHYEQSLVNTAKAMEARFKKRKEKCNAQN